MEFSKLLKQLRQNKGVSIKVLAREVELNYTYISKLENSKVNPSSGVIDKFANYFDYDVDELMLAAGKIPEDVKDILRNNPVEAIAYLRRKFIVDKSKEF